MTVVLQEGALGIDTNSIIGATTASLLIKSNYTFVNRYIPRTSSSNIGKHDLTRLELELFRCAKLLVMPVQHVESETSWVPTADKGLTYGAYAGEYSSKLSINPGTNVWLDLEGVAMVIPVPIIINFCNNWYDKVAESGFKPGIYVGWRARLTSLQLYKNLKFRSYWGAYNLDLDQFPATRGLCMKQSLPKLLESQAIPNIDFNKDLVSKDLLGDLPIAST